MTIEPTPAELDRLITEIAIRLADEETVQTSVQQVYDTASRPTAWEPTSVAMGPLGNALLFSTLHRSGISSDRDWNGLADRILGQHADEVMRSATKSDSLFEGAAGAFFAYIVAAAGEPRWTDFSEALANELSEQVIALDPLPDEGELSDADYDLVAGRAGTLIAVSAASAQFPDTLPIVAARNRLFDDIDQLLTRGQDFAETAWIDPRYCSRDGSAVKSSLGYYDMGLSHGLPGLLVALAGANVTGCRDEKRHSLMANLSDMMLKKASTTASGLVWPSRYGREAWHETTNSEAEYEAPDAWCCGAPGIALSLARAGDALRNHQLAERARSIMRDALARNVAAERYGAMSPTFCHGIAGVLACSIAVLGSTDLYRTGSGQYHALVALLSKESRVSPLLFQDFEEPAQLLDDPTVVQGAAGVALTLTLARDEHRSPGWQNLFGLA